MLIFGLPPSFALPLLVHAWAGLAAVVTGIAAFRMPKGTRRHPRWGVRYLWSYTLVFLTASILTFQIWSTHSYLFFIALAGYGLALAGYVVRRFRRSRFAPYWLQRYWVIVHMSAMIGSYMILWIGFLVDNAPKVPGLEHVPLLTFWLLPLVIGLPFLIRSLARFAPMQQAHTQ
jgi:hypothetical protein